MSAPTATLLPFYALCDVSASMLADQRIDALNEAIVATCDAAAMHPVVADRVRLGIISFAGKAELRRRSGFCAALSSRTSHSSSPTASASFAQPSFS
jgi:uncharacterized protein YegL